MCANAQAVRVGNPRIVKELNKFYASMEAEGRLGELSEASCKVSVLMHQARRRI